MSVATTPLLFQAIAEIRYAEGIVFLDKCGSLTRDLEKNLGRGFKFSIPSVESGEGRSRTERMTVRYGPESTSITQDAVQDIARFTQVSSWTWQHLSDSLDVTKKVTRAGVRFTQLFAASGRQAAADALRRAGLVAEAPGWQDVFGTPSVASFSGDSATDGWARIRAEMEVRSLKLEAPLPEEIRAFYPESSVALDLDFVIVEQVNDLPGPMTLRHPQLREYIVRAWVEAQRFAEGVSRRLSA